MSAERKAAYLESQMVAQKVERKVVLSAHCLAERTVVLKAAQKAAQTELMTVDWMAELRVVLLVDL